MFLLFLLGAGPGAGAPKPDYSQRYFMIDAFRLATLSKEINEAAAAGYRVIDAMPLWEGVGQQVLLLEKSANPTGPYEYLLITPTSQVLIGRLAGKAEEDLNIGGGKGFRLLPHTVAFSHPPSLAAAQAIMEKPPGQAGRYQYLVLKAGCKADQLKRIQQAMEQGYRMAGITDLGVVMERSEGEASETPRGVDLGSELSARPEYLCLDAVMSTLQKESNAAAGAGYRLFAYGRSVAFLKKSAESPQTFEYRLLSSPGKVPEAAAAGFRLVPEASDGGCLLLEKSPGSTDRFDYLVIEKRSPDETIAALNQASNEGYRLVALTQDTYVGVAYHVMERPAQPATQ